MRILQLTDTHLFADPEARHYDRIDTRAALAGVLDRLAGIGPLEAVIHTGDASEDGSAESYRALIVALEPFAQRRDAALAVAMGNHDVPAEAAGVLGPGARGGDVQDRVVMTDEGLRIIVLDSSVPGAGYGHLDPEQLAWLRSTLADRSPQGSVLVIHHPPLPAATPLFAGLALDRVDELAAALEGSDVRIVLSGHHHHGHDGSISGVPVHVAPGIANVVDPIGAGEREVALALSGASIIDLPDDGGAPVVTTAVWPNAGDIERDPSRPVYEFSAEDVAAVVAAAGRPDA